MHHPLNDGEDDIPGLVILEIEPGETIAEYNIPEGQVEEWIALMEKVIAELRGGCEAENGATHAAPMGVM